MQTSREEDSRRETKRIACRERNMLLEHVNKGNGCAPNGYHLRPIIMKVAKDPDPPCPFALSYVLKIDTFLGSIIAKKKNKGRNFFFLGL